MPPRDPRADASSQASDASATPAPVVAQALMQFCERAPSRSSADAASRSPSFYKPSTHRAPVDGLPRWLRAPIPASSSSHEYLREMSHDPFAAQPRKRNL